MKEQVIELFKKYKAVILYLFFGAVTTVVNIVSYWLCYNVLGIPNLISNAIAWVLAVAAAYVTNKLYVFESKSWDIKVVLPELGKFVGARVFTGILDEAIMWIGVDLLSFNGVLVKIVSNVLVVILNYIFSKFFIFKKESTNDNH